MKLKLEKQKVTTLSSKDMSQVNGGGKARSNRKAGMCSYSGRNQLFCDCQDAEGHSFSIPNGCS